jgi:hypothetical protein
MYGAVAKPTCVGHANGLSVQEMLQEPLTQPQDKRQEQGGRQRTHCSRPPRPGANLGYHLFFGQQRLHGLLQAGQILQRIGIDLLVCFANQPLQA